MYVYPINTYGVLDWIYSCFMIICLQDSRQMCTSMYVSSHIIFYPPPLAHAMDEGIWFLVMNFWGMAEADVPAGKWPFWFQKGRSLSFVADNWSKGWPSNSFVASVDLSGNIIVFILWGFFCGLIFMHDACQFTYFSVTGYDLSLIMFFCFVGYGSWIDRHSG